MQKINNQYLTQCPLNTLEQRAFLLAKIRQYFAKNNTLEVETPILSSNGNTDINIESFTSESLSSDNHKSYLRTSAEFPMKRLLCSGIGDVYELGKVFRRAEASSTHNIEFTMLEWYRLSFTYQQLIQEVTEFFEFIFSSLEQSIINVISISYGDVFSQYLNIDIFTISCEGLNEKCNELGYSGSVLSKDEALDFLFATQIQNQFAVDALTFITLYPVSQAALAEVNPEDHRTALRFEVFYQGYELGNGYQELTNVDELQKRFEQDNLKRKQQHQELVKIDDNLLKAMQTGMPNCSGIAIGVDRLLMCLLHSHQISDVLSFNAENA